MHLVSVTDNGYTYAEDLEGFSNEYLIGYLEAVLLEGIPNIKAIARTAEDKGHEEGYQEGFDTAYFEARERAEGKNTGDTGNPGFED